MSELKLTRPIVFFDLETTGTNQAKDRIVEISLLRIDPDGGESTLHYLVNPEIPIPEEASKVHGIYDADIKDAPAFRDIAGKVAGFMEGADLGGYNCLRFDIPMLAEHFLRESVPVDFHSRKVIDVQVIFHKKETRTLSKAYEFYCGKNLENAHTAEADTRATFEVLKGQLKMYDDLPADVAGLDEFSHYVRTADLAGRIGYNSKGKEIFAFGKHSGKLVESVLKQEPAYYNWIMDNDFPLDTKHILQQIKVRVDSAL
ncbi:MAG: exonuclease domain-containing protein [Bacteroidales bacterium]|nr:exonuclease domain-containing protein [Bacteroidales bacterium]